MEGMKPQCQGVGLFRWFFVLFSLSLFPQVTFDYVNRYTIRLTPLLSASLPRPLRCTIEAQNQAGTGPNRAEPNQIEPNGIQCNTVPIEPCI